MQTPGQYTEKILPYVDRRNSLLRLVRISLVLQLFDPDFEPAFFRKGHVLLLHVVSASVAHLLRPLV